jgi:hypothetical protein
MKINKKIDIKINIINININRINRDIDIDKDNKVGKIKEYIQIQIHKI